jgi:hypothetical protein
MAAQRKICSVCGYDMAGLPTSGECATCPECGHAGPPTFEPDERNAPWWAILAGVAAAGTNFLGLFGSLCIIWLCFQADWSQEEALNAAAGPAVLALLSGFTLVAMMLAHWSRVVVLRVILTIAHVVLIGAAGVQAFQWAAGMKTGVALSIVSVLIGQPAASIVALNLNWLERIARDRKTRSGRQRSTTSDGTSGARF